MKNSKFLNALVIFSFSCCHISLAKVYTDEAIPEDYLNVGCGRTVGGAGASGRIESSHSLTYDQQMDCWMTISVTPGRKTLLHFNRFEFESQINGACVDYLNVHDGASTSATRLNADPMCGVSPEIFNMTSTGDHVTLHMVTDNTAVYRGFEVLYVAVTLEPCDANQFGCSNGYCIESKLQCNRVNECGDSSDEVGCEEPTTVEDPGMVLGVIIGCSVGGLILLIILAIVLWRLYEYYQFQKWLKYQGMYKGAGDYDRAYPVSDVYSRYQEKKSGRRDPHADWIEIQQAEVSRAEHAQATSTEVRTTEEMTVVQSSSVVQGTSSSTVSYGTVNPAFTQEA